MRQQVASATKSVSHAPRQMKAALSTRPLIKSRRVCVRPVAFKAADAVEERHPTSLKDELRNLVVGLQKSTRTANIRTVGLRSCNVSTNTNSLTGKNRCEQLELEVEWEGDYHPTKKAEQQNQRKLSGLARVSMSQEDSCDQIKVRDVRVMEGGEDLDLAGDPAATQAVVMAVESMDSVVMERLNDFLWDVEKSTATSV